MIEIQMLQKETYQFMSPNTDSTMMNELISGTGPKPSRRDVVFCFLPHPALWNVYPARPVGRKYRTGVKCEANFSGTEPIPLGSAERKKK